MKIGYARVSTDKQTLDSQIDALKKEGCEKIFEDIVSGSKSKKPELEKALEQLRSGDVLVVWRFDRLGRVTRDLLKFVQELRDREIGLVSVTQNIDTTKPDGYMVFTIFAAIAENERNLLIERTTAGLAAARARGRQGGRKEKLTPKQVATLKTMYDSKQHSTTEICNTFKISRPTLYAYVRKATM